MLMPSIFGENLFDDFMDDFSLFDDRDVKNTEKKLYGHRAKQLMKTDIQETDSEYKLEMDLPGFRKEEVAVSLNQGYLTVSAEKGLNEDEKDKKTGTYIRKERYTGACERSFYIGDKIQKKDIKAEFKHGILKLTIPKLNPASVNDEDNSITIEG